MVTDSSRVHDRFAGPSTDDRTDDDAATDRVLVVLAANDPDVSGRKIRREIERVAGEVHLLFTYPTSEYAERRRVRDDDGIPGPFTANQLAEEARRIAMRVGREGLDLEDGRFEAMGSVGDKRSCLQTALRRADYQRVYVADQPLSIWDRLVGNERLSTELARTLPTDVVVRSIDALGETTDELDRDEGFDRGTEPTARPQDA